MDKKRLVITCVIIVLLLSLLGIWQYISTRVSMNPPGTVGNTAGNLNNRGLFCESDGTVFFSNLSDGGTMYAMTPDEGDLRKINNVQVCNILAGGKYLYYFQLRSADADGLNSLTTTYSFNRCDQNGKNVASLTRDVVVTGQLVDNYLYLLAAGREHPVFYKIKIDRSDQVHLADYSINPACAVNGSIYYNGTLDDHHLYRLDTATDTSSLIWNGNLWYPVLYGDYVYFMDVSENYRLCRYSLAEQIVEVLTNDRVDCFNVGSGYIYYQKNSATNPQLKCMHTDGSNVIVLAEGNFTNINMTSRFVYFQEFGKENSMYHSALGSDWYGAF